MQGPQAESNLGFERGAKAPENAKIQASNKPATDVLIETLSYLDLDPEPIIALQNLLTKSTRFHEEDILTAARSLPIARELLARKPELISELPENLQDKRNELEVAGIQVALALISRVDRSVAVDVLRIATADAANRSAVIFDSLSIRLKQAYASMIENAALPVRDLLASVRVGTASEANADFLRGFFWPLLFSSYGDSAKTQASSPSSPFQRITTAGFQLEQATENFLVSICPKSTALPTQVALINHEIALVIKENKKLKNRYKRLAEIIDGSESIAAQDVLQVLSSLKGSKEVTLPYEKLLVCEKSGVTPEKEDLPLYASVELAYRTLSKLDPITLTHQTYAKILARMDELVDQLAQSKIFSLHQHLGYYIGFTAPAWGVAFLINNFPAYALAAVWTLFTTYSGIAIWNGYDKERGGREEGISAENKDVEKKFSPIKDKLEKIFDELVKTKRAGMPG